MAEAACGVMTAAGYSAEQRSAPLNRAVQGGACEVAAQQQSRGGGSGSAAATCELSPTASLCRASQKFHLEIFQLFKCQIARNLLC